MKFQIEPYNRNVPDEELVQDVRDVAKKIGRNTVTTTEYKKLGKYGEGTLRRRLGKWPVVLEKAGLQSGYQWNISDEELFDNIKNLWITLGRQPRYTELKKPLSKYSTRPYDRRFGSFRKALAAFVEYINDEQLDDEKVKPNKTTEPLHNIDSKKIKKRTKREISERLRFSILLRDGFRCQSCGRSPIKSPGIDLHVDHILPWSQGGETIRENLQTKCKECNLGKGNAFDK